MYPVQLWLRTTTVHMQHTSMINVCGHPIGAVGIQVGSKGGRELPN